MRLSLGFQILIAVLLGVFCGLFFGPLCNGLKPVGDIYVMLLQMVALPYICFSLMHGLGSITPQVGKKLFLRGWPFWVILWAMIFIVIYFVGLLIPKPVGIFLGSAAHTGDESLSKSFISFLVPENPIYDLANNVVPAITVFGLIIGLSLMHLKQKEPILSLLERSNQTIELIFKWLAILSPIGVFAHIAVATGTVYFEDLYALEFYVICFILMTLFVTFWLLPALLESLTPLTYKEAVGAFKFVCLLPFATALPTIALPFINIYMKKLGEKHAEGDPQFHATSQTAMPICYSFGQIGNCMILFFILFLSFFYRHPFVGWEKTLLSILIIPLSLGSSASSINSASFLIDKLNFPQEAIGLFTQTMALTVNFQVLLSVASVLTLVILVLYAYYGLIEVKWARIASHFIPAMAILGVFVFGAKQVVHLQDNFENLYMNLTIGDAISKPVATKTLNLGALGSSRLKTGESVRDPLEEILKTGVLKVGFDPTNIPYAYYNRRQELVGFDIAYAYQLARDLDCSLEFVPLTIENLGNELSSGLYDIAMSAILMNEIRIREMDFSHPYTEQDNVLVVPAKKRSQFIHLSEVQTRSDLKFGVDGGYRLVGQRHFPLATMVQARDVLTAFDTDLVDAYVWSHVSAFIWCLSYPEFAVVDYAGLIGKRYFAYPVKIGSFDWGSFLNNWLILKEQSGFKTKMHRYWIEGIAPNERAERWSILRNALHWVD